MLQNIRIPMFLLQQNKAAIGDLIQKYSDAETDKQRSLIIDSWGQLNNLMEQSKKTYSHSILSSFIDPTTIYAYHQFTMKKKNRTISVWAMTDYDQDSSSLDHLSSLHNTSNRNISGEIAKSTKSVKDNEIWDDSKQRDLLKVTIAQQQRTWS